MRTKYFASVITVALALLITGQPTSGAADSSATSASLTGIVKFLGTVSNPARIDMSADPKCAQLYPAPIIGQDIVKDASGGLQNVIVFISEGLGERTSDPPPQPAVIDQKGCLYRPRVIALRANQKLRVVNSDQTTHNIHPMPKNNREWNKSQPPGLAIEETFTREEIAIPVKCNIHPWMRGYIAVFKHPYFAMTGKNGSFDLKNLPPGAYTIQAWHEKLGTLTQKIIVGANETKTVQFVFKAPPGLRLSGTN
jgi:plastocyanin